VNAFRTNSYFCFNERKSVHANRVNSMNESINSMRSKFTNVDEISHILKTVVREFTTLLFNMTHKESEAVEVSWKRLFITLREVSKGFELFKDVISSHSVSEFIL